LKRLSGWDAVLLYSETPTVHMHTLKLAVIDLSELKGRQFGIDEFRQVIHSRLYKLDPFRYELVDIPFKFHHPMWRENCEVDLDYHVRPYRVDSPGGRRQLDEAVGRIASTPLDRRKPLWEMYFIEGLANGRIAVLGKIHHALADGSHRPICWRVGWTCKRVRRPSGTPMQPIRRLPRVSWCDRRSATTCVRSGCCRE
jgi:diacylglycerol O-acyltransferase / wax synthase